MQTPAAKPAPQRRTQQERRSEAEQRLLEAARRIVARKGWAGMTLAEVGTEAGYSRGLATHHFGSKAELLRALAGHANACFMDQVRAAPRFARGLQTLIGFVGVYLSPDEDEWLNNRCLLALMAEAVTEDSDTAEVLGEYNAQVVDYLSGHIRHGIEQGEIRAQIDPAAGAALVLGAMRGVMLQYLLKPARIDLALVRRQLQDFVGAALGN
ncbi:TetR/AcrR family transcriptional regulator [Pseudomonas sp. MT3]|uniref:TetR/AcrR family transcriptional regulator n=1 Tax=Pseudomonas sp. ATCC 13867 TaxID=1294143 RepID=UPI0002C4F3C9|nr:TetR/AcrR family transcriptional regulator [Pseudomonas sp. ATCC 13867]AGI24328.1 TetR family transcriptional regulator [Pseudomonas sp. ATCC 13867]RFQ32471.1 TetR/AcrR family transcriptional regulator [Pseudomonas sp. ATCC 13867]